MELMKEPNTQVYLAINYFDEKEEFGWVLRIEKNIFIQKYYYVNN